MPKEVKKAPIVEEVESEEEQQKTLISSVVSSLSDAVMGQKKKAEKEDAADEIEEEDNDEEVGESPVGEEEAEEDEEEEDEDEDGESESEDEDNEEEESEIEALRKGLLEMKAELARLKGEGEGEGDGDKKQDELKEVVLRTLIDSDEAYEQIFTDRESFNTFLKEYAQGIREIVLRDIPEVVGATLTRQSTMKRDVDAFYKKNPDLLAYGQYLTLDVNRVQSEHPDWTLDKVLDEAATRFRKTVNLTKKASGIEEGRRRKKKQVNPPFARSKGQREGAKKTDPTSQSDMIASMLQSVDR